MGIHHRHAKRHSICCISQEALEDFTSGRCMYIVKSVVIDWIGVPYVELIVMVTCVTYVHSHWRRVLWKCKWKVLSGINRIELF